MSPYPPVSFAYVNKKNCGRLQRGNICDFSAKNSETSGSFCNADCRPGHFVTLIIDTATHPTRTQHNTILRITIHEYDTV